MNASLSLPGPNLTRRVFAFAGAILLMLSTAACFDNEPAQRKAFTEFLQKRVIDKPGLHIPIMSDNDVVNFGPYADHYRIMNGFHRQIDAKLTNNFKRAGQLGQFRTLEDLRNRRALFPDLIATMATLHGELDKAQAEADAAHKALKQPPDLKAVYDKAYDHMVTKPAQGFREILPLIENMLPAVGAVAAFLDDNRDTIEVHGNQTKFQNAALRDRFTALAANAQKVTAGIAEGQRKLRAIATGR